MRIVAITAWLAATLASTGPQAAEITETLAADGVCEQLIIAGTDLTGQCGTALVLFRYDDGRVAISAGTGGQSFFGLGNPERMVLFAGQGGAPPWSDHPVDHISAGAEDGAPPLVSAVTGSCTYESDAPAMLVTCEATDAAGSRYTLIYRTDGRPAWPL